MQVQCKQQNRKKSQKMTTIKKKNKNIYGIYSSIQLPAKYVAQPFGQKGRCGIA